MTTRDPPRVIDNVLLYTLLQISAKINGWESRFWCSDLYFLEKRANSGGVLPSLFQYFFDFFTTGGRPAKSSVSPRREATYWSKVASRLGETLVLHKNVPRRFQKRAKTMEGMLNIAISEFCAQSKQSALSALSWLWHAARNHHSLTHRGQGWR